jgi:hypothetical protein
MTDFVAPVDDMRFALDVVAGLEEISKLNGFQHADPDTVGDILEEAGRFFAEVIAPLNRTGDLEGSVLDDEGQRAHAGRLQSRVPGLCGGGLGVGGAAARLGGRWPSLHGRRCPQRAVQDGEHGVLAVSDADPLRRRGGPPPRLGRDQGVVPGETGERGVDGNHAAHRAAVGLRPREHHDPGRTAGRQLLPPVRNQDLHHLGRPRPHRQHHPHGAGEDPRRTRRHQGDLDVPGAQVPTRRRWQPRGAERLPDRVPGAQAGHPRLSHMRGRRSATPARERSAG